MDKLLQELNRKKTENLSLKSSSSSKYILQKDRINFEEKKRQEFLNQTLESSKRSSEEMNLLHDKINESNTEDKQEIKKIKKDEDNNQIIEDKIDKSSSSTSTSNEINNEKPSHEDKKKSLDQNKPKVRVGFDPSIQYHKNSSLSLEKVVYKFFHSVLEQWEMNIEEKFNELNSTAQGRKEINSFEQCKEHIKPLFKLCKKGEVPIDILEKLVNIVKYAEEGDFVKANDEYIRTAIGNAPWPIGLTMVGIHERTGREKISTSKIAHVMNNEEERKYLTSVKRLLTIAQDFRPDVLPSKKVH